MSEVSGAAAAPADSANSMASHFPPVNSAEARHFDDVELRPRISSSGAREELVSRKEELVSREELVSSISLGDDARDEFAVVNGDRLSFCATPHSLKRLPRTPYHPSKQRAPQPPAASSPRQDAQQSTVHRVVHTRPQGSQRQSRLQNHFAPTSRPGGQSAAARARRAVASTSQAASFSGGSIRSVGSVREEAGGLSLRRLARLFRRPKEEKRREKRQIYQQQQQQHHQQQQQQQRLAESPRPDGSRSLHTFTFADAKIYNPTSAIGVSGGTRQSRKGPAPQPPQAKAAAGEDAPLWWNVRTLGARESSFSADVMLVRNAEPHCDYETAVTRF